MTKFDILLSTYNGELYLSQQIDSLIQQEKFINKIYIRDDGSSDSTLGIIRKYKSQYHEIIELVEDELGNLGSKESFFYLSTISKSKYVAFCDQDDIWHDNKLEYYSNYIEENQLELISDPLLIHSDLTVVDEKLNVSEPSFMNYIDVDPRTNNVCDILIRNTVTGCTIVANRQLLDVSYEHKELFHLHDVCCAIFASIYKNVFYIDEQLILYRQHEGNVVGAPKKRIFIKRVHRYIKGLFKFKYKWNLLSNKALVLIKFCESRGIPSYELEALYKLSKMSPSFKAVFSYTYLKRTKISDINRAKISKSIFNKS